MLGYAGSVAFSGDGREIAITPTRGGRLHRFSDEGAHLEALSRASLTSLTGVTAMVKLIVHWPGRPVRKRLPDPLRGEA